MQGNIKRLVVEGTTKQHKAEAQRSTKGNHKKLPPLLFRASLQFPSLRASLWFPFLCTLWGSLSSAPFGVPFPPSPTGV